MIRKNRILFLLIFIAGAVISGTNSGCAIIIPPGGGPIDSLPPRLVRSVPKDSSRNFTGNKIELVFNEFVELENVSQEIIMSPTTKNTPQVERKLNIVSVKFRDTLDANTTYSINFGNGIKDLNEGNKASQFTYIFSTGNSIDSLSLRGKLMIAETGATDTTLIVSLYKDLDDSAVSKHVPRYYTKLNNKGEFVFRNLPAGKFHLFALGDGNGNKLYDQKNELFAFTDEPVDPSVNKVPVTLYAFAESKESKQSGIDKALENRRNTKQGVAEKLKLTNSSLEGGKLDLLSDLEFHFNNPIRKFDSSKLHLTDEKFNPITKYSVSLDTSKKKLVFKFGLTENTPYKVIIEKEFATDTAGNAYAKTDTIPFYTAREAEYGSFKINFKNTEKYKHPVLQLVKDAVVVASYKVSSPSMSVKLFRPSAYEIRILEDENDNGVWDAGNYWKKKQPEKATLLNTSLNVKPAWDTEIIISL